MKMDANHGATMLTEFFEIERQAVLSLRPDPSIVAENSPQLKQYQKALLCTLIDGLAKLYLPTVAPNERFQRFVTDFGCWADADLVSVPILLSRLTAKGFSSPLFSALQGIIVGFDTRPPGGLPLSALSLSVEAIGDLGSTPQEDKMALRCTHLALLYAYRNYLVHEFRPPGYAMESGCEDPTSPCYQSYLGSDTWHLGFPLGFFAELTRRCIEAFRKHLLERGIDPYDNLEPSSLWDA